MPPPPSQSTIPTAQHHSDITVTIPTTHQPPAPPPPTQINQAVDHPGKAIFQSQMKAGKAAAAREAEQRFAQHRQAAVSGKHMIQTYLHAYTDATKPKAIMSVGSSMASWDADQAIAAKVREINVEVWEPNTSGSLQEDDYFIRLPGTPPIRLLYGSEHGTIGELYDIHRSYPASQESWFRLPGETASSKKTKEFKETIHIWLVLRIAKIEQRDGPLPTGFLDSNTGVSKKRKAPANEANSTAKKSRVGPPVSTFQLDLAVGGTPSGPLPVAEPDAGDELVQFEFAEWIETPSGRGQFNWTGDDLHEGKLACRPFANGASKLVFLLVIAGKRYVAKRYAVIPDGNSLSNLEDVGEITMLQNLRLLEQELRVQKQGAYFLKEFYSTARKEGAVLSTEFTFTDCWFAREIVNDAAPSPSKASGVVTEDYEFQTAGDDPGSIYWLIEPYHAIQTTKYSGTLSECDKKTLPFKTMSAFAHFTHYWSFGTLVYVDLQSSHAFKNGRVSRVLFDTMTHTQKRGSSGPGDHGVKRHSRCIIKSNS
ncbi:hypothetical protein PM082_004010 [Marasmius tenuissimus]|nr:hypothetical protein PM082_004010 [Marasmius tenuissimus]